MIRKFMISWKPCISFIFEAIVRPRPVKKMAIRNMKINPSPKLLMLWNPEPENVCQTQYDQALNHGYGCTSKGFPDHDFCS